MHSCHVEGWNHLLLGRLSGESQILGDQGVRSTQSRVSQALQSVRLESSVLWQGNVKLVHTVLDILELCANQMYGRSILFDKVAE